MHIYSYARQRVDNIKCNTEKKHHAIKINTYERNTFISIESIPKFILSKARIKIKA